jgi:hypothetical protein
MRVILQLEVRYLVDGGGMGLVEKGELGSGSRSCGLKTGAGKGIGVR